MISPLTDRTPPDSVTYGPHWGGAVIQGMPRSGQRVAQMIFASSGARRPYVPRAPRRRHFRGCGGPGRPAGRELVQRAAVASVNPFDATVDAPGGAEDAAAPVYRVDVLPGESAMSARGALQEARCGLGCPDGEKCRFRRAGPCAGSGWPANSDQFPGADAAVVRGGRVDAVGSRIVGRAADRPTTLQPCSKPAATSLDYKLFRTCPISGRVRVHAVPRSLTPR